MSIIRDPVSGTGARVRSDGRLKVDVVQKSDEAFASERGNAFVAASAQAGVRTLTLATVQTYALLFLQNNSVSRIMALDSVVISTDVAGAILFITKNPTVGALTNNTPVEPSNRNFASTEISDVSAEVWDEVGTVGIAGLTLGEEIQAFILPAAPIPISLAGAVRLGRTNGTLISIQNPTLGPIEVTVSTRFHMDDPPE